MSVANKMLLQPIPECLHDLTELEERLVAQRIPFMKIMNLPKGKQKAIIGQVVNVPVDTAETVAALPRTANSSGFIPLKLKRKKSYTGHVLYQMIRPHVVEAALRYLVDHNKHYQNILLNEEWQKDFQNEDEELWNALVEPHEENEHESSTPEVNDNDTLTPRATSDEEELNSAQELSEVAVNNTVISESAPNGIQEEDSLRGLQYNTCIQPDDLANYLGNEVFSVAPGEGRLPLMVGNDVNNEVLTFPTLFPDGKFGFDVHRLPKLTLRKYFQARLLSEDTRFARNTEYLFYAQYLTEQKQISDSINIALRKAKLSVIEEDKVTAGTLKNTDRLKQIILQDQGQRFMQNVRGSPAYCKKLLSDLLAMIRQLGSFTFFLTLSAADLRWPETISVIASQYNVTLTEEDVKNMSWEERCHWIRRNPVTAARQFDYRVQLFVRHILGSGVIGEIDDYLYRVEFQKRGSPHIHMVIWIKDAPKYASDSDREIAEFVDTHISCSLPDENDELREKVNEVQRHVHSNACKKKGKTCRFSFPRPPSFRTIVCRGSSENASEKASDDQTRNDSPDKQDRQQSSTQKNQHQNMTLNRLQQQSKKQEGTNDHLHRKDKDKNKACSEKSDSLVTHHKKSKIQTETNHVKETLDNLNHQNNNPGTSISHSLGTHKEPRSKNKLGNGHEEKMDQNQNSANLRANYSKSQLQPNPESDAKSDKTVQNRIYEKNKVEEQPSAQENLTRAEGEPIQDQPDDPTVSQNAEKQKHVLNMMFKAMFKLDITHDTTVEDILIVAGLSQEDYEQSLTNSKSSNGIILKRRPCERFINNYNPKILPVWGANMDIQYVSDPYACVMYISSYVTKPEHEMSALLEQTSKQAADCDIRQQLRKIGTKFLASREVSAQEAVYRVLSLPLSSSSREVIHVSTDPPSERLHLLKPMSFIKTLDDDDEDIYQIGLVERYMKRPANLNHLCLAEFASSYRVDYKKTADERQDVLNENDSNEKTINLQDGLGVMRKRTRPAVIRTFKHSVKHKPEKYYHSMLMLYYPWRREESFLEYGDGSFEAMYHNVQQIISDNMSKFEKHAEIVEAAVQNLEDFGPPEDAWAEIAAESEHDREKQRVEGSRQAEEFAYIDPEVHSEASHAARGGENLFQTKQAWVMEDVDYHRLIQSLNLEQRQVFSELYKWFFDVITSRKTGKVPEPIRTFISGCAGTGKSHLIKAIYQAAIKTLRPEAENPDDTVCLLTAPTSPAAYNINGQTLHSAFSLPLHGLDPSISQSRLSRLRNKLCSLNLLIIDEISMVGSDMLFIIHKRLSEINGTTNKLFGGVSVLAFGDLSQLPPVGHFAVYKLPKSKMAKLYGSVWNDFNGFELTEIMRQQEDQDFAKLLTRVHKKEITDEDKKQLESRVISKSDPDYPCDAVHAFATNALADAYNAEKLSQLRSPVYQIKSEDTRKEINTSEMSIDIPEDRKTCALKETIQLAIGAKVMITKNVCTKDGLVNGMMGTVVGFHPLPSPTDTDFRPVFILVQLDDPKAGYAAQRKYRSVLTDCPDATPIVREEVKFKVGKYGVAEVARRQFPLSLSWACTIHKVQGRTLPKIVVSCEGFFRPGMFYVAVSRVKSVNCLYFTSLDFSKIIANSEATEALDTMLSTRPLSPMPIWLSDMHSLVISYLNVNSLVAHKDNLKCHQILNSSDIITVTETWLHPNYQSLTSIDGFTLVRADRALCYSEGQLSKQTASFQRHGGVASYIKNQSTILESSHLVMDIEYLRIVVQIPDGSMINIITVYRPPSQNLAEFLGSLQRVLATEVDNVVPTIVCGDFNVDGLGSTEQQLFQKFKQYDFLQIVQEPTHIQGACLDHVYVRRPEALNYRVVPVSFSPHAAIQLQYYSL